MTGGGCSEDTRSVKGARKRFAKSPRVVIISDPADPVASGIAGQWAVGQLRDALSARTVPVNTAARLEDAPAASRCVLAAGKSNVAATRLAAAAGITLPAAPESVALLPADFGGRSVLLAFGSDARGLVYALTDRAEAVAYGDD